MDQYYLGDTPIQKDQYDQLMQLALMSQAGIPDSYLTPLLQKALTPVDTSQQIQDTNAALQGYVAAQQSGNQNLVDKYAAYLGVSPQNSTGLPSDPTAYNSIDEYNLAQNVGFNRTTPKNFAEFARYNPNPLETISYMQQHYLSNPANVPGGIVANVNPLGALSAPAYYATLYGRSREDMYKDKFGADYGSLKNYQDWFNAGKPGMAQ